MNFIVRSKKDDILPQAFYLRMLPKTHSFGRNDFGTPRKCFPFGGIHPAGSESLLL